MTKFHYTIKQIEKITYLTNPTKLMTKKKKKNKESLE